MSETTPIDKAFGFQKSPFPRILTTANPLLANLKTFPPIQGLPEGRVRIRLRADEISPVVRVRLTGGGIRAFLINVHEDGSFHRGPEVGANYRFDCVHERLEEAEILTAEQAEAVAQYHADRTGKWWAWCTGEDGKFQVQEAKVLNIVQLGDTVLMGDIVVAYKPGQTHGQLDIAVPRKCP